MKPPVYSKAWPDEVQRLYQHDMQEVWDSRIAPHIYMQYHYLLDFYESLIDVEPALDVIDVGCAQATLSLLLAEKGHRVTAVDIRPDFLKYAQSRYETGQIQFLSGNIFADQLDIAPADVVFANQIIEHVLDPVEKISSLSRYLKPAGRLIMTTPNHAYIRNGLPSYSEFSKYGKSGFEENTADGDGHVFAFQLRELVESFEQAGLSVERAGFLETPCVNGHMKLRYLVGLIPLSVWRCLDRVLLSVPGVRAKLSHQLYVIARRP